MDCAMVRAAEVAERYVLGRLDETERDAFEEHLLGCDACAGELESLCALRSELARDRERIVAEAAARPRAPRRTWLLAVAAGLLMVATGLGLWLGGQPATVPGLDLAELARMEPPAWAPVRLRGGDDDDAERRFRDAMELYGRGDWAGALPGLRAAAALEPEAPHIAFYLGACALLAGDTGEGLAALERTTALGDTPYLEEARFLLAKARLGTGDLDGARAELAEVVALDGDRWAEAQALIDRLDQAGGTRE